MIAALAAAFTLLALPAALGRVGRHLAPGEWAWLCAIAIGGGAVLIETVLVLRAAPGALAAAGFDSFAAACSRVLGPLVTGGPVVTWTAAAAAAALPAAAAVATVRARSVRQRLAGDLWLGDERDLAGQAVVVLPADRPIAVSFRAPEPVVVVSQGLVDRLDNDELAAVVDHEAAHLAHRHQRLQVVRVAVAPTFGRLPIIRRSIAALDLALERAADEAAAGHDPNRRAALRRSLLTLTGLAPVPGVAGFADAETLAARLGALDEPPAPLAPIAHPLLYVPGLTAAALAALLVADRIDRTVAVVAMARRCFI